MKTTNCAHIAYEAMLLDFLLAQEQRHALLFQKGRRYFLSLDERQLSGLLDKIEQDYQLGLYSGMVFLMFSKLIRERIAYLRRPAS